MTPSRFLRTHTPFCDLSEDGRTRLESSLEITFVPRGTRILERGGAPCEVLYLLRKGSVRLELDGQLVDDLGPGEVFGVSAVLEDSHTQLDTVAQDDCLLYGFPKAAVRALVDREPAFAAFFLESLSQRLRATTQARPVSLTGDLQTRVSALCSRQPVTVLAGATVSEAAQVMDREQIGSVLVRREPGEEPSAILTDRDLRRRVLAHGRSPETPVREVMSSPLKTLEADALLSEALLTMLRARVRHLPVLEGGRIVGVLAHSDLLHHHLKSPAYLLERVLASRSAGELEGYVDELAAMIETTARGGLGGSELCRLVAALNDALSAHLIDLAVGDLGPPPCAFAWIVFGSEGRHEQALVTDQDNALVYAGDTSAARVYFERLADRVVGDLIRAGFPPCAGGYMATGWCHSLERWVEKIRGWGARPEPEAMMHVANLFDFRAVRGDLDLEPIEDAIREVSSDGVFLAQLARESMRKRPPIGFLRRFRRSAEGIDLKAGAIVPIVGLARVYALEAGDRSGSTLRRLRTARRAGLLSAAGTELLGESFRFVFDLRLRRQLAARARGEPASNSVHLPELSAGERQHLKEAMLAIRDHQSTAAHHYGLDLTG